MSTKSPRLLWQAALLVLAGLTLAIGTTGIANASGTANGAAGSAATSAGPYAPAPSPAGTSAPAGAVTVMTKTGSMGTYLVDGQGRSLYLFVADKDTTSTCNGQCAAVWPPLVVANAAKAGSGANASMLATSTRSGGAKQVTYAGHPLYYFASDKNPGDTTGQGVNNFGGLWWLVAPNGTAITK
jgi:predicted lipoprotein with Yx(FWY)xxD motif